MGRRFHDSGSSLYSEAVSLFGRQIVEMAEAVDINQLAIEADLVAEGARQLREQAGHPERQRAIITAMDDETAMALCRWIIDPGCMAAFIARGRH